MAGKDIDHLTLDDLAPVDEFHLRGRPATTDLAELLALRGDEKVLDVGCGIGGPSRYLAKTFGCRVTGLDLTPEFCRIAAMLAERTGLAGKVDYREGDALAMPFAEQSFDVVWSQSAVMNIADRDRLYGEIRRVLKPHGRYAFADVVAGSHGPLHFPVPWAREPSISFLLSAEATRRKLKAAGLKVVIFEDRTAEAVAAAETRSKSDRSPSALGLHLILGPDAPAIYKNTVRNFLEGRLGLIQGVVVRG
ncbi:MAG: class I SAM-dependent methyltransferase [Xanthobacteraceae bacterium]|nr:class I SAM-dependent methyltransferase [Xanthobacteraceae bacterium]